MRTDDVGKEVNVFTEGINGFMDAIVPYVTKNYVCPPALWISEHQKRNNR